MVAADLAKRRAPFAVNGRSLSSGQRLADRRRRPFHDGQLAVSSRLNPEILIVLLCYVNGNASQSSGLGDTRREQIYGPIDY